MYLLEVRTATITTGEGVCNLHQWYFIPMHEQTMERVHLTSEQREQDFLQILERPRTTSPFLFSEVFHHICGNVSGKRGTIYMQIKKGEQSNHHLSKIKMSKWQKNLFMIEVLTGSSHRERESRQQKLGARLSCAKSEKKLENNFQTQIVRDSFQMRLPIDLRRRSVSRI